MSYLEVTLFPPRLSLFFGRVEIKRRKVEKKMRYLRETKEETVDILLSEPIYFDTEVKFLSMSLETPPRNLHHVGCESLGTVTHLEV